MRLNLQLSCYNGGRYLPYLFASLKKQTLQGWHLYILDNASDEENKKMIADAVGQSGLPATLFRVEANIGFSGAHNYLFRKTKDDSDAVQLLNDDAILEPDWLERCLHVLETQSTCGAVEGRVLRWDFDRRDAADGGKTTTIDTLGLSMGWTGLIRDIGQMHDVSAFRPKRDTDDVFGVSGCLPMYRVSAAKRVSPDGNLFDASYVSYKEDCELACRLQAIGYRSTIVNGAVAYHRRSYGMKVTQLARPINENSYQSYRNHLWLLKTTLRPIQLVTTRIGVIPTEIAKACYWLGRQPHFVFKMVRETWQQRRELASRRTFVQHLRCHRGDLKDDGVPTTPSADIAVIMVTHDDASEDCLQSLIEARRRSRYSTAFVVADNQSKKFRANEFVQAIIPDATVLLRNGDFGYGSSMNRGADQADAKYYFILNPDTKLIDPELLNTLYDYMEQHPDVGLVGPKILNFSGELQDTCRRYPTWYQPFIQRSSLKNSSFGKKYLERFLMKDYDHATERDVDWVQGSAMFVRGDIWKRVGGFDERYWLYFEDIDLCRTIQLGGARVTYLPTAVIQHAHGRQSAKISNFLLNILLVKETRGHLISWWKYMWKWS